MRPSTALLPILFLAGSPLIAHDFWIQPSTFQPDPGENVAVELRVGEAPAGDALPRLSRQIARFEAIRENGKAPPTLIEGADGTEPAGRWAAGPRGEYTLVYESSGSHVELEPRRQCARASSWPSSAR